jgi:DivIVA domain-containing protein
VPFEPEEIENKEFLAALRGYDRDEVRAFLQDIADDYRALMDMLQQRQPAPSPIKDPYDALGAELGQILKVARESGEKLRKKAEAETSTVVARAEQEAKAIRDSVEKAARKQREDADRYARETRSRADREAADKTTRASASVDQLREAEAKLRERMRSMEAILRSLQEELGPEEVRKQPRTGAPTVTSPAASSDSDDSQKPPTEQGRTIRLDQAPDRGQEEERIFSTAPTERAEERGERRRPRFI